MQTNDLKKTIREIAGFPKPGITFYDVTTLFRSGEAFRDVVERLAERYRDERIDAIAAIEARGFILGAALAARLGVGLVLVRKAGKLPHATESETYDLEYGRASIEVHRDQVGSGQRILVVDDVLATGGTAAAVGRVVTRLGGNLLGYAFLLEIGTLGGRERLGEAPVYSLLHYA